MLISVRNPFEVVMIFAGLLAGIAGLFSPVSLAVSPSKALPGIYALHGLPELGFSLCLVLGTGTVALSLFLGPLMTLLIKRAGMIWLAALFVPYGVFLFIEIFISGPYLTYHLDPNFVLSLGYGVACAARSLQITHDLQQYRRELQRIAGESR